MEENILFHNRYFLEKLLGRGNFSEVWVAKDTKTDVFVALKIYAPATGLNDQGLNVLSREFALVVDVNHKNLLKPLYYDTFERKPYLVLPYCKKGSILGRIGTFNEEDAWRLIRDAASGLAYLHSMNPSVIHQDIKPDNIMINDRGEFLIADFGISSHVRSTLRKSLSSAFTSAGTPAYMAPERFGRDNTPILANDIYSLGATVYEMLTSDPPFGDGGGLLQRRGAEIPIIKGNFSKDLKKVLYLCLQEEPWKRPTAVQLEQYAQLALDGKKIPFGHNSSSFKINKRNIAFGCFILGLLISIGLGTMLIHEHEAESPILRTKNVSMPISINSSEHLPMTANQQKNTGIESEGKAGSVTKKIDIKTEEPKKKDSNNPEINNQNGLEEKGNTIKKQVENSRVKEGLSAPKDIEWSLSAPKARGKSANPNNVFYVAVEITNNSIEPRNAIVSLFVDKQCVGEKGIVVKEPAIGIALFEIPNIKKQQNSEVYAILRDADDSEKPTIKSKVAMINMVPFFY